MSIIADVNNVIPANIGKVDKATKVTIHFVDGIAFPAAIAAPTAGSASSIAQTSFSPNWSAVTGATGYYLDVSTSPTFSSFVSGYNNKLLSNVTTTSVTGLTANTPYYYRVRATNGTSTSVSSSTISVTTLVNIPSVPVASAATSNTTTGFTANWGAATGATKYYLDVSTSPTFASFVSGYNNLDVGNVLNKPITGLTAGTTYYYRVRAANAGGTSASSGTITTACVPSAPLLNISSNVTSTSFTANWNAMPGATKYYLDVSTNSSFTAMVFGYNNLDVGNVTSKSITGLTSGVTYYYRLRAYNIGGTSANSITGSESTPAAIPDAPTALTPLLYYTGTPKWFQARWSGVSGANGYYLDVYEYDGWNDIPLYMNVNVGNVTTYQVNVPHSGLKLYKYQVRSYNGSGTSGYSNMITTNAF